MNLIDKDDLLRDMRKCKAFGELSAKSAIRKVEACPTVDVEPVRHGKWLFIRMDENKNGIYECSLCHKGETHVPQIKVNYCWNCGAKMESEEE